jgi:hypothetical protein
MKIKRKILIIFGFFMLLAVGAYFFIVNSGKFHLFQGAQAVGGYPYQIGLTNVTVVQCQPSCCSTAGCRCCIGEPGTLCPTILTEAQCVLYSDVFGSPAGGMGSNALFLTKNIALAGLSSGGQLIAGGMSPVLMDNGVLASVGGCAGCIAKTDKIDRFKEVFDFVIALFK